MMRVKKFFIIFELVIILILMGLLYEININNYKLYHFSEQRLAMIEAADRMRHSSDDLTNFARAYVVTGDKKYYKQYFDTLAIRNGQLPRPYMYNAIYWDLHEADRLRKHPPTKKLALDDIFKSLPFTEKELYLLRLSHKNSDDLVNLEVQAFNFMKEGKQQEAIKIMWSKEYYDAKAKIMGPIDDFMINLQERTKKQVDDIRKLSEIYFDLFVFFAIVFVIGNIYIFRYIRKENQSELEYKNKLNQQLQKQQYQLKKLNDTLEEQVEQRTKELQIATKRMKDSIEYAFLIQQAILPKDDILEYFTKDNFIIWQPKDIVGGDVYFSIKLNENEFILMVIDGAGHGVPGAFVTMIVKAIETQIVAKIVEGLLEPMPNKILEYFNVSLKTMLSQDKKDNVKSNAGFDGGILYYNKSTHECYFSGAKTDLYIINNGELDIVKGDKKSVGFVRTKMDQKYTNHTVNLRDDSILYISTDGLFDQEGDNKKRFSKTRFKELIKQNYQKPLKEQKNILLKELNDFKKDIKQTDDITVIGIKFKE